MPNNTIEILKQAAALNREEEMRQGSTLYLPSEGNLIISGDLHGNRANFNAIVRYADLENNPDNHLILQEIVHGGPVDSNGGCLSFKLVYEAAKLKVQFPKQVHFIMGNHDTSVILGTDVLKNGKEMNKALFSAMENFYKEKSDFVVLALKQFLFSQALAARTQTGIFIAHSLPGDAYVDRFDNEVLNRDLQINDMVRPNSAYLLTWGRRHSQKVLDELAATLKADFFVLGHQRQEEGFAKAGDNLIILASDHYNGAFISLKLGRKYKNIDELLDCVVKLADLI